MEKGRVTYGLCSPNDTLERSHLNDNQHKRSACCHLGKQIEEEQAMKWELTLQHLTRIELLLPEMGIRRDNCLASA